MCKGSGANEDERFDCTAREKRLAIQTAGVEIRPSLHAIRGKLFRRYFIKEAYPIVMRPGEKYVVVFVPDFNINTQGYDYADAMEMVRDAIGLMGIDMEDEKEPIPQPSRLSDVIPESTEDVVTLVDVDFAEYRRKNDMRTVRRNVSPLLFL